MWNYHHLAGLFCAVWMCLLVGTQAGAAEPRSVCLDAALRLEPEHKIPRGLLYALALTESGRWDADAASSHAWPWTVRSGPDAFVADDLTGAVDTVKRLRAQGRRNIDIGCMQINLMYHADAFPSIEAGFDPATNVRYAASFLQRLRGRHHSWARAIEYYHSSDRERASAYRARVYAHWNAVRRQLATMRRASAEAPTPIGPAARAGSPAVLKVYSGPAKRSGSVLRKK